MIERIGEQYASACRYNWAKRFMKNSQFPCIMLGLMLPLLACHSASGDDLGQAVQAAIRKVEPSIVRLRVIGGEQSIDGDAVQSLVTTGIVISADGEILTSQFALEGNPEAVLVEDQFGKRTIDARAHGHVSLIHSAVAWRICHIGPERECVGIVKGEQLFGGRVAGLGLQPIVGRVPGDKECEWLSGVVGNKLSRLSRLGVRLPVAVELFLPLIVPVVSLLGIKE